MLDWREVYKCEVEMIIQTLRALPPSERKEFLLGLGNEQLDRLAAEVQGFQLDDPSRPGDYRNTWRRINSEGVYDWFWVDDHHPSTDLNQAYELVEALHQKCFTNFTRVQFSRDNKHLTNVTLFISSYNEGGDSENDWSISVSVLESEAKSHARAVVVLAVLGLLEG